GPHDLLFRDFAGIDHHCRAELSVALPQDRPVPGPRGLKTMAPIITNIEDLRVLAKRRVPKALFDYVDGGSYDKMTLRANRTEFEAVTLRQRVLVDTSQRDLSTTMLGEKVSMPVALAPTGMTGLLHGNGEMLAARAAEKVGIKFCLSTLSINTLEEVAGAVT